MTTSKFLFQKHFELSQTFMFQVSFDVYNSLLGWEVWEMGPH